MTSTTYPLQTTPPTTDEQLLTDHQAGNKDAFATLYQRHRRLVTSSVTESLSERYIRDVDDIVQEVFIALQGTETVLTGDKGVDRWLSEAVRRHVGEFVRHVSRKCRDIAREDLNPHALDDVPECDQRERRLRDDLAVCIATLPANCNKLVTLVYLQGFTMREAAIEVGIPLTAAFRLVTDGVARLKTMMDK